MARVDQTLLDKVMTDGVLVDLDIREWRALRRNKAEDLGISGDIPDFVVGLGTKRLIDKEEVDKWSVTAMRARVALLKHSLPFPVTNGAFVTRAALPKLEDELTALKEEFDQAVRDFLPRYHDLREQMLAKYPEHRERLEAEYPTEEEIQNRCSFTWATFSVSIPKALKLKATRAEEVRRYQEALERKVEQFVESSVAVLRSKVVELCGNLSQRIKAGEIISEPSLNKVRKFIDQFSLLNFAGDESVADALARLKKEALNGYTAEQVRTDDQARTRLADALDQAVAVANDITDRSAVSGAYRRRINIDKEDF